MTGPVDYDGLGGQNDDQQGNPSWHEYLADIPEELHEKVTPAFEKWDKNVTSRFDRYNQEYAPWKPVIKAAGDPETAQFSVNLLRALNENPAEVVDKIREYYQLDKLQGTVPDQGQNKPNVVEEDPYARDIQLLKQQNEVMAAALIERQKREDAVKADQWIETEMSSLKKKYQDKGPFSEKYVYALSAQTQMSLEDAVKDFYDMRDREVSQYRPKPLIMGGGGGAPGGNGINPRKLNDKDTNSLIVDILNASKSQQ